jgi:putative phosphoesterase
MSTLIGVISDSHDHLPNLRHALEQMIQRDVTTVIHCGDLIAPFVTVELATFDALQVHTVFGNNDGDRFLHAKLAAEAAPNVTHHGESGVLELEGHRLAFCHYEDGARGLARRRGCEAAFYGHTHLHCTERDDELLALNPGELLGMKVAPSFCLYDLQTKQAERCAFTTQPWPALKPTD